jgi:hypothetical protein
VEAILFDREQVDHLDDLPERPDRLNGSKLLWVDVDRGSGESAGKIASVFELDDVTCERLASSSGRAQFQDFGRYMHMTTYSPSEEEEDEDLIALECVVGKNWGDHGARSSHSRAGRILRPGVGFGRHRRARRAGIPCHPVGMGTRRLLASVRASGRAPGGVRRESNARRANPKTKLSGWSRPDAKSVSCDAHSPRTARR